MSTTIRRISTIAALCLLCAAPSAHAGEVLDRTASCLERTPVCVDPESTDVLSDSAARDLTDHIEQSQPGPFFIAVVPAEAAGEAGGSPEGFVTALEQQVGTRGTYAVIVGSRFRVDSPDPAIERAADLAFEEHSGEGVEAVLGDLVDRAASDDPAATSEPSGGGPNLLAPLLILGVLLLVLFLVFSVQRRTRLREEVEQLEEVKRVARDDLVALGDDIRSLDLDVEMPDADPVGKEEYGRAVDLYKQAQEAFDTSRRPEDLEPVTNAVEEGRYYVASARARLEGRAVPERRPPCFFDPRHGPSTRDVEWAPPGGAPRPVPACEADAQRVEQGLEPQVREIEYAGGYGPYWNAPSYYGPWAGGFFGGFGGGSFLGGLLIGNMLGGGFGFGAPMFSDSDAFGGGDFGGGDFGGGDFGGGDFGGGFGGGDF
jgi:hypothetical protein